MFINAYYCIEDYSPAQFIVTVLLLFMTAFITECKFYKYAVAVWDHTVAQQTTLPSDTNSLPWPSNITVYYCNEDYSSAEFITVYVY